MKNEKKPPDPLAKKREIAREHVRARRMAIAAPPIVRRKRNRNANQENRREDAFGRRSRPSR